MKWIDISDKLPRSCDDILFTDGKKIYKGWLETHEFGEDLVFFNDTYRLAAIWPENITHWMELPKLPT